MDIQYSCAMRVRIELRRSAGKFTPRYRPQQGIRGVLTLGSRLIEGRTVAAAFLRCVEPEQGYAAVESPVLYDPLLIEVLDDQIRLAGWEAIDRTHFAQQWDCFWLPDRYAPPRRVEGRPFRRS
jgi:hypothetical protein